MGKQRQGLSRAATATSLAVSEFSDNSPLDSVRGKPARRGLLSSLRTMNSQISKLCQKSLRKEVTKHHTIRLKAQLGDQRRTFACFRESDVFDMAFGCPMRAVAVEEDFDCESGDELIKDVIEEQEEAVLLALQEQLN